MTKIGARGEGGKRVVREEEGGYGNCNEYCVTTGARSSSGELHDTRARCRSLLHSFQRELLHEC